MTSKPRAPKLSKAVRRYHQILALVQPGTLAQLAKDEDDLARYMVAANTHTAKSVIQKLARDASPIVSWRAKRNLEKRKIPASSLPNRDILPRSLIVK